MNLKFAENKQNNQLNTISLMKLQMLFISSRGVYFVIGISKLQVLYSSNDEIIINETKQITSLVLSKILVLHQLCLFYRTCLGQATNILEKEVSEN